MTTPQTPRKHILHFAVATDDQAQELNAAWREIASGKRERKDVAAEATNEIMERAREGLVRIIDAIRDTSGSGQARCLVAFLAGVYNGNDFPFDLTGLRVLDSNLAGACIHYLNYVRLGRVEVHTHMSGGGEQMQSSLKDHGFRPRLCVSERSGHEALLWVIAKRLDREAEQILKESLEQPLSGFDSTTFGGLLASQSSPGDELAMHTRLSRQSVGKPLCGAEDGPWKERSFDFGRLNFYDCRSLVLYPEDDLV